MDEEIAFPQKTGRAAGGGTSSLFDVLIFSSKVIMKGLKEIGNLKENMPVPVYAYSRYR